MKMIESLYYGNLNPTDREIPKDSEYAKLLNRLNDLHDLLHTKISAENKSTFKEYEEAHLTFNALCEKDSFLDGFRLGAKLILDVLLEQ